MIWIALIFSLLACAMSAYFYWRSRRNHELSVEQFSNRVSKLLSEFNSVTSDKVDLLDDRTEELRRIVDLANLKIKKLNRLIDRVEAVEDVSVEEEESSAVVETESDEQNRVLELHEEGKSPAEIADVTDLTPGEISVILKINRTRVEETKA